MICRLPWVSTATGTDTLVTPNDTTIRVLYATDDLGIDTSVTAAAVVFLNGTSVTDLYGNNVLAIANVPETDGASPVVVSSTYNDVDTNGLDVGDTIDVGFSENLNSVAGVLAGDISLPVAVDTLGGAGLLFALNVNDLQITLGAAPVLTPAGNYDGTVVAGSSSGLNVITTPTGTMDDAAGNNATDRTGTTFAPEAIDIQGDNTVPTLTTATLRDLDKDGQIDAVDLLFDEPVDDSTFVIADWTFSGNAATGTDTLVTTWLSSLMVPLLVTFTATMLWPLPMCLKPTAPHQLWLALPIMT